MTRTFPLKNTLLLSFTLLLISTCFGGYTHASFEGYATNTAFPTGDGHVYPGANELVTTSTVQSDGKIIIGGVFTQYNDVDRGHIARLNSDGSLDTSFLASGVGTNGEVNSVAVQSDGKILIGGDFTTYNGTNTGYIALLNSDGTLDTNFLATNAGANSIVTTIAVQSDRKILIGGEFTTYNGTDRGYVARLNSDGSLDTNFLTTGVGADNAIQTLALQSDGKILIGGWFLNYNGTNSAYVARLNSDGSLDTDFLATDAGADYSVWDIEIQSDGKILIGGEFGSYNGTASNFIARLNSDGSLDTDFLATDAGTNYIVSSIAIQDDNKIVIGGFFESYNGTESKRIIRLNADGSVDAGFLSINAGADHNVHTLTILENGKIFMGGYFYYYNSLRSGFVACLQSNGSLDTSFHSGTYGGSNGPIIATALQSDGKIIVAGWFDTYNGEFRGKIARINADGTLDNSFTTTVGGVGGEVIALAIQDDGKILIGGHMWSYNETNRGNIARLNADGSLDTNFLATGVGANGDVKSIVIQDDGKIVIGGRFLSYNGIDRGYVARLNSDGSLDESFLATGTGADSDINAVALQSDGKIVVAGQFLNFNGTSASYVTRLMSDGSVDGTFASGTGANHAIYAMHVLSDDKIILAGDLNIFDGNSSGGIVGLNSNGSFDTSFDVSGRVLTVAGQSDGKIIAGGEFLNAGGLDRRRIARFNSDGSLDTGFLANTAGADNEHIDTILLPSAGKILLGGWFTSFDGIGTNYLTELQQGTLYQINSSDASFTFLDKNNDSLKVGTQNGSNSSTTEVHIFKNDLPVSDVVVNLSSSDRNWSSITADMSIIDKKAVISGIASAPGVTGTHTLYVPREITDISVTICPDAQTLSAVAINCSNNQTKIEADTDTEIVDVNGQSYWKVSGLSGTGGISNAPAIEHKQFLIVHGGTTNSSQAIYDYLTSNGYTANIYPQDGVPAVSVLNASADAVIYTQGTGGGFLTSTNSDNLLDYVTAGNGRLFIEGEEVLYDATYEDTSANFIPDVLHTTADGNDAGRMTILSVEDALHPLASGLGGGDSTTYDTDWQDFLTPSDLNTSIILSSNLGSALSVYDDLLNNKTVVFYPAAWYVSETDKIDTPAFRETLLDNIAQWLLSAVPEATATPSATATVVATAVPSATPSATAHISASWYANANIPSSYKNIGQPFGVDVLSNGDIWYTDILNNKIVKISQTGTELLALGRTGGGDGEFRNPTGITHDDQGNIYVADSDNNRVQKFNADGAFLKSFGSFGTNNGQFAEHSPSDIQYDSFTGTILTVDRANHRIQKFSKDGNYISQFGSLGTGNGQFDAPTGIYTNPTGKIYIVDYNNGRVEIFSSNYTFLSTFGSIGGGDNELVTPIDVVSLADGSIIVSCQDGYNIYDGKIAKFNANGSFNRTLGYQNPSLDGPDSLALDPSGNVVVSNRRSHNLARINSTNGSIIFSHGNSGVDNGKLKILTSVVVDSHSNIYAYDRNDAYGHTATLSKYNSNGVLISKTDQIVKHGFYMNIDNQDRIAIGNTSTGQIGIYDTTTESLTYYGGGGSNNGEFFILENPSLATAFDSNNNIYVADTGNFRIQKLDSEGNYISQWGEEGTGNSQFTYIAGVATDSSNNVYVIDRSSGLGFDSIQKFTSEGQFISKIGVGVLYQPSNLTIDGDRIFVSSNFDLSILDLNGTLLQRMNKRGSGPNQFAFDSNFSAVAVDPTMNKLYVADVNNNRIESLSQGVHIHNVMPGLDIKRISDGMSLTTNIYDPIDPGMDNVQAALYFGNRIISTFDVDLTLDPDWNAISGNIIPGESKSVVVNLNQTLAPGISSTHTLYVPRTVTDTYVVICPDASSITQLSGTCTNAQIKVETDDDTEIIDINGQSYWRVSGLTGTGGISNPILNCNQTTELVLSDNTENTASTVGITFKNCSPIPAGGSLLLNFPSQWNLAGVLPSDIAISSPSVSSTITINGNMITLVPTSLIVADTNINILIGDVNLPTNPPNSGVYYVGILTTDETGRQLDEGSVDGVIDNANNANVDNVMITAQLFQQCSLDLGSADIIDLGLLVINTDSSGSHNAQVDCNAETFTLALTDETNGFRNSNGDALGDATSVTADPTAGTLDTCVDPDGCFGVTVNGGTQQSGDANFSCDTSFTSSSVYSGLSDTQPITICSGTGPVDSAGKAEFFTVAYGARVQPDASAGIYSDLIFYTLTPSF